MASVVDVDWAGATEGRRIVAKAAKANVAASSTSSPWSAARVSVAIATLPMPVLMGRVVMPLLREIGVRWADGRLAIAQERLVSSLLRMRLLAVLNPPPRERRPRVLFATLMGTEVEATPGEEIEAGERFFLGDAEVRLQRSDG